MPDADALSQALSLVDGGGLTLMTIKRRCPAPAWPWIWGHRQGLYGQSRGANALRAGVSSALINLGGNVQVLGAKPDGSDWVIGIADAGDPAAYLATLSVSDCAVVTSGDYQRYFEEDGRRYHHILDPKTGIPQTTAFTRSRWSVLMAPWPTASPRRCL